MTQQDTAKLSLRVAKFLGWPEVADDSFEYECIVNGEPWLSFKPFSIRIFTDALHVLDSLPVTTGLTYLKPSRIHECQIGDYMAREAFRVDAICLALKAYLDGQDHATH